MASELNAIYFSLQIKVAQNFKQQIVNNIERYKLAPQEFKQQIVNNIERYKLAPQDIELDVDTVLGHGAGGIVQKGVHKPTGTPVAIKTIKVRGRCDSVVFEYTFVRYYWKLTVWLQWPA
jgi:hypothetical protein